jgi:hypothetical protein
MESIQNNRLVRRFFKCSKCREVEAKLVNPHVNNIYCSKCSSRISEISENDYRKYKQRDKMKQNEDIRGGNQMPYRPNEELLRRASDKYNKPPSREHKHKHKNNENHKKKKENPSHRHQSTNHYSNLNFNNINNNNNINNIHVHNNNYNNINHINIINNDNNEYNEYNNRHSHERRENNNHNHRRREHSMDPNNQNTNNFFSDFFRGMDLLHLWNLTLIWEIHL